MNLKGVIKEVKSRLSGAGEAARNYGAAAVGNARSRKMIKSKINNEMFIKPKVKPNEESVGRAEKAYKEEKKKRGLNRIF